MLTDKKQQVIQTIFGQLQPILSDALKQLFQQDFALKLGGTFEADIQEQITEDSFPFVGISLKSDSGSNHLITLPTDLATKCYGWMLSTDPPEEVGDEQLEGLQEGVNQVTGQLQAALDDTDWDFKPEDVQLTLVEDREALNSLASDGEGVQLVLELEVDEQSYSLQHYGWNLALLNSETDATEAESGDEGEADVSEQDENSEDSEPVDVHSAEFESFAGNGNANGQPRNINMLMDVELEVYVELGRKKMLIQDLLKLGKGSLIELDRSAGEPLDIFIGDKKLAEGEVVVVDDQFGIRITHLIGPNERIKSLA